MRQHPTPIILWTPIHEYAENDCACSTNTRSSPDKLKKASLFWKCTPGLHQSVLNEDFTLIYNPLQTRIAILNGAAQGALDTFTQRGPLDNPAAQQLAEAGLLQPDDATQLPLDTGSHTLLAWLHVTNACNLRCVYCYINKTGEAMTETTGKAAIDAIFRSAVQHGFQAVKLKYTGGEATLNFALIKTLHTYAHELAGQTGLELQEVILSNGVAFGNPMLDFIRSEKMRLMISLDGIGAEHDAQRIFINGRGSYDQVARGIDRAIERGVRPHLSITVTGRSTDGIAKAVAFALDRDLLFNLNFYRDHDPQRSSADLRAEDERLIAAMRAAFAVIEARLPRQSLIGALVDRASFGTPHTRSCGAGHDYLVIGHNGGVAQCQMEIERPITDVFAQDPLAVVRTTTMGFQNLSVEEKEGCRECQWRYWCAGGCSLLTYRVTGRSDVKSPYCHVYKALYPEVLRLEGLRLLKWQAPRYH